MNNDLFQPLLDATDFLKDGAAHDALLKMQTIYLQKLYFVAFVGQYSAGKSCLLNNLLGRKLLPEGTMETTSLLTYIRYGQQEKAKLYYLDGSTQILALDQVTELAQSKNGVQWDMETLDYLEIFLPEDMLRSGMVLLDTPGVNTLIERHERLLESSLAMAAGIVYVAGHSPSRVDAERLTMLTKAGFNVVFVRTHCDEIKASEESVEQMRADDWKVLAECGVRQENRYYLSNLPSSSCFAELTPLRQRLEESGNYAGQALEEAVECQLKARVSLLRTSLESHKEMLEQIRNQNTEALKQRQEELFHKIQKLNRRLTSTEESLRKRVTDCQSALRQEAMPQLEQILQQAEKRIRNNTVVTDATGMTDLLHREASTFMLQASELIAAYLDSLVREINGEFSMDGMSVEVTALPDITSYRELQIGQDEKIDELRSRLSAIQQNSAKLEDNLESLNPEECMQLQNELKELEESLQEVQRMYDNFPPYTPRMIQVEDGRAQPSQIARTIGAIADWAMLLIPGDAIVAGIGKIGTSSKALTGIAQTLGKFDKVIKTGDSVKDILFALKNIDKIRVNKKRQQKTKDIMSVVARGVGNGIEKLRVARQDNDPPESILNYLTIEYWAGKIGEQFDRPPQYRIDQEYEEQYRQAKAAIVQQRQEQQKKAYQKKVELGLLQKEQDRLKAEQDSLRVDQDSVSRELAEREGQLREAARQTALTKWRQGCAAWYKDKMSVQLREMVDRYIQQFPSRLEKYQKQRLQVLHDALVKEQKSYEQLKDLPEDAADLEIRQIDGLLEEIHNAFPN